MKAIGTRKKIGRSSGEQLGQGELQPREKGRGQDLTGLAGELGHALISIFHEPIHLDHLQFRIHDPVLRHTEALIELPLDDFVGLPGSLR